MVDGVGVAWHSPLTSDPDLERRHSRKEDAFVTTGIALQDGSVAGARQLQRCTCLICEMEDEISRLSIFRV